LSSQLQERRVLKWGGPVFHYAAFAAIAGHVLGILILKTFTDFLGISEHYPVLRSGGHARGRARDQHHWDHPERHQLRRRRLRLPLDGRRVVPLPVLFHPEAAAMTTAPLIVDPRHRLLAHLDRLALRPARGRCPDYGGGMTKLRAAVDALALLAVAACMNPDPVEPPSATRPGAAGLVAVGDSITAADSPDFSAGELGAESWVNYVVGEGVELVGGWAAWGATTGEMAQNVEPVDGDVLVVMAGTNDVALGTPFTESAENIAQIVATIRASEVIISGIPPIDHAPENAADFNHSLEEFAHQQGWHWVDAGASVRTDENRFARGMASDGVHPTAAGAKRLGEHIATAIDELAE